MGHLLRGTETWRRGGCDAQTTVLKRGECIGAQACLEMKPRVNMCMAKGHTELLLVARKPFLTIFKARDSLCLLAWPCTSRCGWCKRKSATPLVLRDTPDPDSLPQDKFDAASADSVHFLRSEVPLFKVITRAPLDACHLAFALSLKRLASTRRVLRPSIFDRRS